MPNEKASPAEIRAWALEQGLDVAVRGRLKPEIVDAYDAAHAGSPRKRTATKAPAKTVAKPVGKTAAKPAPKRAVPVVADEVVAEPVLAVPLVEDEGPSRDDRLADLERQLAAAVARITALEKAPAAKPRRFGRAK